MKTSLAIVLATAALMFGAILSLTSIGSAAEYGSYWVRPRADAGRPLPKPTAGAKRSVIAMKSRTGLP